MARSVASAVLIVLTCILVPVALLAVWVENIALDTDRYVATVAPLATDPAVQDAAVHRITEAVGTKVNGRQAVGDIADWLQKQGLPPRAADAVRGLGPQLDSAVNQAVTKVATRVVDSDAFATVWTTANRAAHNAVVHALTGEGRGAVGINGGTVTLDVGTAVDKVKQELVDAGLKPADKIPQVDKQLVLFQSDQLGKFRKGAHLLDVIGNWFPVIVVLLGVAGVLLAHRRRRALARTALGAAFACLVVAVALIVVRDYYLDHLPPQVQSKAAASAVFDTLLRFLRVSLRTAIVLGVVIALGAYFVGPGRLPVAVRGASDRTADSAARWADARHVGTGRAGAWTLAHRRALTLAALLIVALVFALWNHPTVLTVVVLVLVLLAVLAVLALLAAGGRVQLDAARGKPADRL
ncbi:aromatic ring-opening dioxygenase LigA [Streptomyces sp. CB01883]|nr:aromatic ring-opening dioxygenase LigA [Streptomyces sp. CB01883]